MRHVSMILWIGLIVLPLEVKAGCMDSVWVIGPGSLNSDLGSAVALAADGNAVICGYYDFTGITQGSGWLIKLDPSDGSQLWSRTYPVDSAQHVFLDIASTADGGFICGGWYRTPPANDQQYWLFRVNANGDSLWSRSYGHEFANQGRCVVQAADGGYAIAGRAHSLPGGFGQTDWWILKTDEDGDSLWSQIIGTPLEDTCLDMILTADGNYLLVGYSLTDTTQQGRLAVVSQAGEILWNRMYDFDASVHLESALAIPGGYLVCGSQHVFNGNESVMLMAVDDAGHLQWHRRYELANVRDEIATAIQSDGRGGYYVFGHGNRSSTTEKDGFVLHISACGDSLGTTWVGNAVDEEIWDAVVTPGGMLVTAGVARLPGNQLELQGYGLSADTCNAPPCAFERALPEDSSLVETANTIVFSWTRAADPDADPVSYLFHAESNYPPLLQPADTVLADTFVRVTVPIPTIPLDNIFEFRWHVRATDGQDTVSAANGEGFFRMDIPQATDETGLSPADFGLTAFPNPFNAVSTMSFSLQRSEWITLSLFDLHGRLVETLAEGNFPAGSHTISIRLADRPSGIYFTKLATPTRSNIVKLVLLK